MMRPGTTRRRARSALVGLLLAAVVCAAGCSSSATAGSAPTREVLTFGLSADPSCLDPQLAGTTPALTVARQLVDSLTTQDPRTGAIKPWIAQSWKVNANSTAFTFKLRPGVTFSDGSPLDAAAVKANLDGIVKLGVLAILARSYLAGYRDSVVDGPDTLTVNFTTPNAQFLQATSTVSLGLLSPATLKLSTGDRCAGHGLVGSGPFTLRSYTPNSSVILVSRAGYDWPSALASHSGPALLGGIDFEIMPEPGIRVGSLISGQIDGISDLLPPEEKQVTSQGEALVAGITPGIPYNLTVNLKRPVISDPVVRRAVAESINRQAIVSTVLSSSYPVATGPLSRVTPGYENFAAELGYDPAAAERQLSADGWLPGRNGIRVKNGVTLSLKVIYSPSFNSAGAVLEVVQEQLKAVGIGLVLKPETPAQGVADFTSGNYDFDFFNLTRDDPDVLRTFYSTQDGNYAHLPSGTPLDKALSEEASTLDSSLRLTYIHQAEQLLISDYIMIPLVQAAQVNAFGKQVHGAYLDASGRLDFYDVAVS